MTRRRTRSTTVADGLAGAFLAGDWEPRAMAKRGKRALGERRAWIDVLSRIVFAGYPEIPSDRPRELATFIAHCEPFELALHRADPLPTVHHWTTGASTMGPRRWPVPPIADLDALARFVATDTDHLAWFADRRSYERTATDERLRHYRRTWVSKRDGSARLLESPKRELKDIQREILHEILDRIPPHDAAHGFRPGRSVHTGAAPHQGRAAVVRIDLESFFSGITAGRVFGIFRTAGYPEPVAHSLAGLCTTVTPAAVLCGAPNVPGALWEPRRRMLARLRRPHLAQGSPTSPALANLSAHRLDCRLTGLARTMGATYTRYADDLIFSGDRFLARPGSPLVRLVERIVLDEGFAVHPLKTRTYTQAQRQYVTGLVVNEHVNVRRSDYDHLRAILHDAVANGVDQANRDRHPEFRAHLEGRMAWVSTGNETRAAKLQAAFDRIVW